MPSEQDDKLCDDALVCLKNKFHSSALHVKHKNTLVVVWIYECSLGVVIVSESVSLWLV